MKKTVTVILSTVIGALLILGGGVFGSYMYNRTIPHFDNYRLSSISVGNGENTDEMQATNGYGVNFPDFYYSTVSTDDLLYCYQEVQEPLMSYAQYVVVHYNNRARLDPEVECTKTRLTVKFTGYGVLEDGTKEDLSRTYIFDIEGASAKTLPKLLNKAEIYPEIL